MACATPLLPVRPAPVRRFARRGWVLAAVVVAAVLVPLAGVAGAHADVDQVSPNAGSVLDTSPRSIQIYFTEAVDVGLGGIFLYDANGRRIPTPPLRTPSPTHLVLPIGDELADGTYIVAWRVVSEDTHSISGTWTFRVGDASAAAPNVDAVASRLLAGQQADRSVSVAWAAARWMVFATLALLVGAAVFASAIWPPARRSRRAARVAFAGWIGLTLATVLGTLVFGAYSHGGTLVDAVDTDVVRNTLDTRFGTVWLVRLGALVVAFPLLRALFRPNGRSAARLPRWWAPVAAVTGAVLVCTPGAAGHASTGSHRALALLADGVHVGAMAIWLGGLAVLVLAVLPGGALGALRIVVPRFGRIALWCVIALAITGVAQSWRLLGGLDGLSSEFGRILIVKLVFFAVLLAVATWSREIVVRCFRGSARVPVVSGAAVATEEFAGNPGPRAPSDDQRELRDLRRSLWAEIGLGVLVLVATALLVNTAPPADLTESASGVQSVTMQRGPVTVELSVTPGTVGTNDVHVGTFASSGAPLEVADVTLELAPASAPGQPLAVPLRGLGPGQWFSPGFEIPSAGRWRAEASVLLRSGERVDLSGNLEIG